MARSPLSPLLAKQLGAPSVVIGLIVASVTISGVFVKLPSGALSDQFGFRRLLVAGTVVKMVGPFLYLPVNAFVELIPIRLFHGLSTALYAPAASAWVASMGSENRAHRLGIYSAAENFGILLGPFLGGVILFATTDNFRLAFLVSGLIGTLAFVVILTVPTDQHRPAERPDYSAIVQKLRKGIGEIISTRAIVITSIMESAMFLGVGTIQAFLPLYAVHVHLNTLHIGFLFGMLGVTSIGGRPIMGTVSDRIGRQLVILFGLLCCVVALLLIPHTVSFVLLLVLSAIFGLGWGSVTPSTTALIADLCKESQLGSAMGVFGSIWDVGHATGPILAGVLIGFWSFAPAFSVIAAVILLGALLFAFTVRDPATAEPAGRLARGT
ncbi:MAG: MFS transporter [Chloroflexi bacterium]|nr:MFS transporter [Chloroflexota bacterium]